MGCRQVVRHRVLIPAFAGSNPATPAKQQCIQGDGGSLERPRALAKQIVDVGLAIIDKRRDRANEYDVMNIICDVAGHSAIRVDDIVDTAGTL